jgi:hypothetical protein
MRYSPFRGRKTRQLDLVDTGQLSDRAILTNDASAQVFFELHGRGRLHRRIQDDLASIAFIGWL